MAPLALLLVLALAPLSALAITFAPTINFMTVHYTKGTGCAKASLQFAMNWTGPASTPAFVGFNVTVCNSVQEYPPQPQYIDYVDQLPLAWEAACQFQNLDKGELQAYFFDTTSTCERGGSNPILPTSLLVGSPGLTCYTSIFNATDILVYHVCPDYVRLCLSLLRAWGLTETNERVWCSPIRRRRAPADSRCWSWLHQQCWQGL